MAVVFVAVPFALVATSCGESGDNGGTSKGASQVNVVVPDGAPLLDFTSFGVAADEDQTVPPAQDGVYKFGADVTSLLGRDTSMHIANGPDQLASALKSERPEIAVVAVNLAAKLYNENKDDLSNQYKLAGITTWGLNQIVGNSEIGSLSDLKGKTIYSFGRYETPGIVLRAILDKEGVPFVNADGVSDGSDVPDAVGESPDKVTIIDLTDAQSIAQVLLKQKDTPDVFGLLPEPVASSFILKSEQFDARLNLTDEWAKVLGGPDGRGYPQSGVIIRSDFANNPDNADYIKTFLTCLDVGGKMAMETPATSIDIARNVFVSTMFAKKVQTGGVQDTVLISAVNALTSKRMDVHFGNLSSSIDTGEFEKLENGPQNHPTDFETADPNSTPPNPEYLSNRNQVIEFLRAVHNSSEEGAKSIGGDLPDDGFFY